MPQITSLYASLLTLWFIFLSNLVIYHRRRTGTGIGLGEDSLLQKSIRIHGNFAEYIPLALLLMLCQEMLFATSPKVTAWLHGQGAMLVLSRLLHFYGLRLSRGVSFGRFWGTGLIFLLLLSQSIALLAHCIY